MDNHQLRSLGTLNRMELFFKTLITCISQSLLYHMLVIFNQRIGNSELQHQKEIYDHLQYCLIIQMNGKIRL